MKARIIRFLLFLWELPYKKRTLYWIGGEKPYSDPNGWSLKENGEGGAGMPRMKDELVFIEGHHSSFPNGITLTMDNNGWWTQKVTVKSKSKTQ